jgi:tRNA threonylcarbamoyladenosine biosynthesis protein TsaE
MLQLELPDPEATVGLAQRLAPHLVVRDVIALTGPLGAGKTTFARALIVALAEIHGGAVPDVVPSPTFTLVQAYDTGGPPVWHFDLFRLDAPEDALELAIEEAFAGAITVIEWADKLGPFLPGQRLEVVLSIAGAGRVVSVSGIGSRGQVLEAALRETKP